MSPSIPCKLVMAASPSSAVEEAVTGREAMVVQIMADTEAAVGAYNNQP